MKELFLITSHTPDQRREDILHNFVNKLQDYDYDIMICTHCPIPVSIANKVDYILYERQNRLLTNPDEKYFMWYGTPQFSIQSTEIAEFNHVVAILRSLGLGLKTAKDNGYEKVHYFEYDTDFDSLEEIEENSKLLDTHSAVYYNLEGPNSPVSFNINKISENWFKYDYEYLMNFVKNDKFRTVENYESILIHSKIDIYLKSIDTLNQRGIYNGLNSTVLKNAYNFFYVYNDRLYFFGSSFRDEDVNINIIVNNNKFIEKYVSVGYWVKQEIDLFENIIDLILIINNSIHRTYHFEDNESREIFKKNNFIYYV